MERNIVNLALKMTISDEILQTPQDRAASAFGGLCANRIEELFREYKQQVGGFSYHFWTASMPKLNHYSKKTDPDPLSEIRDSHSRNKILAAIRASEMFVFCSSVAMGILQLLALDNDFVKKFVTSRYLRTRSQETPSEGTVMYYLRKYIFLLLGVQPDSFITQYIREKQQRPKTKDNKPDDSVAA